MSPKRMQLSGLIFVPMVVSPDSQLSEKDKQLQKSFDRILGQKLSGAWHRSPDWLLRVLI